MITLKDIGESVIDAHPMVAILGDGRTIFIAIIIMIISCITAMISSVETSYNNKKMKKSICGKFDRNGSEFHYPHSWQSILYGN